MTMLCKKKYIIERHKKNNGNTKYVLVSLPDKKLDIFRNRLFDYANDVLVFENIFFLISFDTEFITKTSCIWVKGISESEMHYYTILWHTYEFSNHFTVVTEDSHFGGMLNYIDTGLLSWDEYFYALLAE